MYQKLTIVGNLGKDPESRYTPSGQLAVSMSVATNRTYIVDGQKRKETAWFRVTAWGSLGENCANFLHQGSKVLVEGRLQVDPATGNPRTWESNGKTGASFDVVAFSVLFLDSREDDRGGFRDDEVPF